jgi:hypothetical protein
MISAAGPLSLTVGDQVIVETEKGLGFGTVETAPELIEGRKQTPQATEKGVSESQRKGP